MATIQTFALDRTDNGARDVELTLDDGSFAPPPLDLTWTYDVGGDERRLTDTFARFRNWRAREAYFQCGTSEDVVTNALEPLASALDTLFAFMMFNRQEPLCTTGVRQVIDFLSLPIREVAGAERASIYANLATVVGHGLHIPAGRRLARLLLDAVLVDDALTARAGAAVLAPLGRSGWLEGDLKVQFERCVRQFRGRDPETDEVIASLPPSSVIHSRAADWGSEG